jgi:hypothetical protein
LKAFTSSSLAYTETQTLCRLLMGRYTSIPLDLTLLRRSKTFR